MKIGYLRMNLPIELDYYNASSTSLGTELRNGIIESFLKKDFEVTLLSPLTKSGKEIIEKGKGENFDYSLFKNIKIGKKEEKDFDVLFIEGAQGRNTCFRFKEDGNDIPFIQRTFEIINNFKGNVFYYQHGNKGHRFPIEALKKIEEKEKLDGKNIRVLAEKYDFFKNKKWTLLSHSNKEYLDFIYKDKKKFNFDFNIKNIPLCYSENFDKHILPKKEPNRKLTFVGGEKEKNRYNKVIKFYSDLGFKTNVIGKWESKLPNDIIYEGIIKGHGKVYEILNDSYACCQIGDKEFEEYGQITTRAIQTIRSGAVLYSDIDYKGMENYVEKEYLISTRTEMREKMKDLLNKSYLERLEINEKQNSKLKSWDEINWEKVLEKKRGENESF